MVRGSGGSGSIIVTLSRLSADSQTGLRNWAEHQGAEDLLLSSLAQSWAWICWQLRVAEDRPEWFPRGKFATILVIEKWLYDEAESERRK